MGIERIFKEHIVNSGEYTGGPPIQISKSGGTVHKLSSNENLFGHSPQVVTYTHRDQTPLHLYPAGTPQALYDALTLHYDGALKVDQFVAGNGGSDILQMISQAFLDTQSSVIISNPCFSPYKMFSDWMGAEVRDVPLSPPDYTLHVEGIIEAIDTSTKIIYLTSPNNPTGTYIPVSTLKSLLDQLPHDVLVVYDEVYHQYVDAPDYTTALPFVQEGYPIIGINSFSKIYGLAALRIGYAYSTPEIAGYLQKIIRPFLINGYSLAAALSALTDQTFISEVSQKIKKERIRLQEGLSSV